MEKSFGEILTDSFIVIKKSYIDFLKICGVFLGGGLLGMLVMFLVMGKDFIENMHNKVYVQNYMAANPKYGMFFLLLLLFFLLLTYFSYSWGVLVVRNKVLVDKSLLKEAFFESIKKFWKVFLAVFLMITIYSTILLIGILAIVFLFSNQYTILGIIAYILSLFVFFILLIPSGFTIFTAILCRDGKFWTIFWESLILGFKKWFKIVGYMFLISLIFFVIMSILGGIIASLALLVKATIVPAIFYYIVQTIFGLFSFCFYTILYLDLADMKPRQTENLTNINQISQE